MKRFAWSDEHQMHVSVESLAAATNQEREATLKMLADDLFMEHPARRYSDLIKDCQTMLKMTESTATRRIRELSKLGLIKKAIAGLYVQGT